MCARVLTRWFRCHHQSLERFATSTNAGLVNVFTAESDDLEAGTVYRYRIGDGTGWTDFTAFETATKKVETFEFVVFGDSHQKKVQYAVRADTMAKAYAYSPDVKFMMMTGDLI